MSLDLTLLLAMVGMQTFFKFRKSQIRKFLGSFRYCKSTHFLDVTRETWAQIAHSQFFMVNPQIANPQISLVCQSANRKPANFLCHRTARMKRPIFKVRPFHGSPAKIWPQASLFGEFFLQNFESEHFKTIIV